MQVVEPEFEVVEADKKVPETAPKAEELATEVVEVVPESDTKTDIIVSDIIASEVVASKEVSITDTFEVILDTEDTSAPAPTPAPAPPSAHAPTPPPTPASGVAEDSPIKSLKSGVEALLTELAPEETEETALKTSEKKEVAADVAAETVSIGAVEDDEDDE